MNGWGMTNYLSSVALCTTRNAFWLLSNGSHSWNLNSRWISTLAALMTGIFDSNWVLQRSHTASGVALILTKRSLRVSMNQVYRAAANQLRPVCFKLDQYPRGCWIDLWTEGRVG